MAFTEPANGGLVRLANGSFRYTPSPNYFGPDSFTYKISDGFGLEAEGNVNILVKSVNDTPTGSDLTYTLNRNATAEITFAANDVEKDELTFRVVRAPEHGELLTYPKVATYTPKKNFVGGDSFTYVANDGNTDSGEINANLTILDVNNPPEIQDRSLVTRQDQALFIDLSATDRDQDSITFRIVTQPVNGTLTGSDTNYVYQPNLGFLGMDGFTFEAADSAGGKSTAKVDIKVTNENTAPEADDLTIKARINTPASVALKATDGEANPLTYEVLTQPSNGALSGSAPKLTYTPNTDFLGSDRFTFKANDGELDSNVGTVVIAVDTLNHPAITTNQTVSVPRNTTARIILNVTDEDGDVLVAPILKGPKNGRLAGRGTVFNYTPKTDFVGSDEFTYKVWDEHAYSKIAKVSITVTPAPPETKPTFESVKRSPDGQMHIVLRTQPGKGYEISVSTNLVDWVPLVTATADGASISVTDTNAPDSEVRFYRAVQQ